VPASTSETRLVPGAYDGVFNAVCHAAASSGMTVTHADPAAGVIQLSTSMGLATWGENLTAHLRPLPTGVEVTLSSALKFGLVDWGKNKRNIDKLFARIEQVLRDGPPPPPGPPPAAWYPDPTRRHESRYWDGAAWTANVADAGVSATDTV
jgi:hypothetical protein